MTPADRGQFVRLGEIDRVPVVIRVNGQTLSCLAGDTLLTAMLIHGRQLRYSEFGDGPRAGFCNMGVCQDCWVLLEDGTSCRACTTYVCDNLGVLT